MKVARAKNAGQHVSMSNKLVRMAQGLTLSEKRVVSLCLAEADSVRIDDSARVFKITAKEYGCTFGVSDVTAYEQLKEAGNKLLHRIAQEIIEGRKGQVIRRWPWIQVTEYHENEGHITLSFNALMAPHLFALRKEFTSYQLKQTVALRSVYSWRLLELLMQWKSTGLMIMTVEDFCHALDVPASARENFGQLRLRVIAPAVKELRAKDGWLIEWEGTKPGGRKITGLEFRFKKNPQGSLI